ncbi:hypothetical protein HELRODRAFT_192638 [Helobdella robusta]|uniref:Uncharacterized protein n=1 Tax=Helobdella robusta TaxID=6412 RepID=T1FU55_HELRO|nr:hypothetical protein HELRODRAFT_192638 [Helobdella robusta]ESO00278.1 hypothetical protein HELRODRAFT_192638 [Helobdella robusta]
MPIKKIKKRQAFVKKVSREGKVNVVAVGACLVVLLFATSFMIFTKVRRLYRQRQVKSMNFDNPVYKKSTDDDEYDDGNVAASAVAPAATSNTNNTTTNNDKNDDSNNDNNNGSNNNNVDDVNPVVVVLSYDGSHVTSNAESLTLIQKENM